MFRKVSRKKPPRPRPNKTSDEEQTRETGFLPASLFLCLSQDPGKYSTGRRRTTAPFPARQGIRLRKKDRGGSLPPREKTRRLPMKRGRHVFMDLLNPRNPAAGSETGIGETPEALPTGRDMKEMALLSFSYYCPSGAARVSGGRPRGIIAGAGSTFIRNRRGRFLSVTLFCRLRIVLRALPDASSENFSHFFSNFYCHNFQKRVCCS